MYIGFACAYQCLYRFFYYVAWVTFESKDLKDIETEISRLLYPDALNPILRAQEREEMERESNQKNSKTISSIRSESQLVPEYCSICSIVLQSVVGMKWFLSSGAQLRTILQLQMI